MKDQESLQDSFEVFRKKLQNFIDISLLKDETSWMDWIANVSREIDVKCWEKKKCGNEKASKPVSIIHPYINSAIIEKNIQG